MDAIGTMTLRGPAHPEPGLLPAGVLALLVHAFFLAFLIFGFSWRSAPPEGMVVDLWSSLPAPDEETPEPVKPMEAPKPEIPAPAPPPPVKPDILFKEKPEKPKPVEPKQAVQKERKPRETEVQQQQRLQREQEAINRELQARQAAAQARMVDEYKAKILAKIKSRIVMPPDLPGNPVAEFGVTLLPGGDILEVKQKKSSGFAAFDNAVERAIHLSKPLPLPPDPALFRDFRDLSLKVHYRE